ncbi:hypothetical protein BN1723_011573 [Verticillium longisporum]|uniref:Uncharacterized protein n=1 Tax=Verticillium longisporum TaxID=100787 RepID=A0A0G4L9W5_VERLO|nr:hypothetical protein BN1723_011573 [Verticillium longisporum]CRK18762.1 hypothetical protein BN1708_003136 [Verticillium longisporum]
MNRNKAREGLCPEYVFVVVMFRGLFQMLVAFDRVSRKDPVEFDLGRASSFGAATTLCFSNSNMRGKIMRLTMQVIPSEYSKYGGDQAVVLGLMESNDQMVKAYGGMKEAKGDTFGKTMAKINQEYEYGGPTVRLSSNRRQMLCYEVIWIDLWEVAQTRPTDSANDDQSLN